MRVLLLQKAPPAAMPPASADAVHRLAALDDFHAQLARAGILLDAARLRPAGEGAWRLRAVAEGLTGQTFPLATEAGALAGYTLIQVRSTEEALAWARRCPILQDGGGEIELRVLQEDDRCPCRCSPAMRPAPGDDEEAGLAATLPFPWSPA